MYFIFVSPLNCEFHEDGLMSDLSLFPTPSSDSGKDWSSVSELVRICLAVSDHRVA